MIVLTKSGNDLWMKVTTELQLPVWEVLQVPVLHQLYYKTVLLVHTLHICTDQRDEVGRVKQGEVKGLKWRDLNKKVKVERFKQGEVKVERFRRFKQGGN